MAGWFAKLMQNDHARSRRTMATERGHADAPRGPVARDARYDAIVRVLRERDADDRYAREKRQRWYRQHLTSDAAVGSAATEPWSPIRLYRFRTTVPCRATPEARALLDKLRRQFPGSTVTVPRLTSQQQALMLTGGTCSEPKQIGWVEQSVETDRRRCNVRHQGLVVDTDGGRMLVLRFHYPATSVRMSASHDAGGRAPDPGAAARRVEEHAAALQGGGGAELPGGAIDDVRYVDFSEIRPALDLRPSDRGSSPRLVWVTRPEVETMNALGSRDYEAFYVRFKLEVLAGIWSSLSAVLASAPGSQWHRGTHYTVVREPDAAKFRIHQRTVDDGGRAVDIGANRIHDAAAATDILLLYLEGDILADVADIYFTLQSLDSTNAWSSKEELFTVIRRFWASAQSLESCYGGDLAAVVRMSQRAVPMPAQALLLKQDWTNLRQSLVDRYGDGGRKAADIVGHDVHRPRTTPAGWPFTSFPAGEVNIGLRVIHRQEWRHLGAERGEIVRAIPAASKQEEGSAAGTPDAAPRRGAERLTRVETTVEQGRAARTFDEIVADAAGAAIDAMKWPRDVDGCINTGMRGLAAHSDVEAESRESSRDFSTRLGDIMRQLAKGMREPVAPTEGGAAERLDPSPSPASAGSDASLEPSPLAASESAPDPDAATYVYSRLQHHYELLTRPVAIQNVVLVAEKLPAPAEIDRSWVRRHDWILAKVLLDESFRDALDTIGREDRTSATSEEPERPRGDHEIDAKRERLFEHIRTNILHYQRAIWQQEDPQQRSMRYRKSGRKVPLEWRFELASGGAPTIDDLCDRLTAANVDGQFATYSGGREADLDQVIDPAGPIGYYGNYAVYHMRPELGGDELFSMLHFFKSPYLRPDPETGAPEVEDPVRIGIAEDPAVTGASDDEIERRRDEMFAHVPQLRLELARARRKVSDGTDPGAVERLARQSGTLRRHFATYLYRRERVRRIALDSDGVVIDVVRTVEAPRDEPEPDDRESVTAEAPDGYRLVLESANGIELVSASGRRDAEAEWAILRGGGAIEPNPCAGDGTGAIAPNPRAGDGTGAIAPNPRAGDGTGAIGPNHRVTGGGEVIAPNVAGSAHTRAAEPEPAIVARGADARAPGLRAGRTREAAAELVILAQDDERTTTMRAGRTRLPEADPMIVPRDDGDQAPALRAGRLRDPDAARLILAQGDGERQSALRAGRSRDPDAEPLIVAPDDGVRLAALASGPGHDPMAPPPGVAADIPEPLPRVYAGRARIREPERTIVPRDDGERAITLRTGRVQDQDGERVIVRQVESELTIASAAGARPTRTDERTILARGDGELTSGLLAGAGAPHAHDRVILSGGDEALSLTSVAGDGAANPHERVIFARDDDWLRPSLFAGWQDDA